MSSDIVAQTDRLYMAIGRVVVEFQFVENITAECLASLMRMRGHEDQQRVAAAMSFRQKVELLCDLYPRRKDAQWPDVEIGIARKSLFAAEEFRNAVVHSFWHVSGLDALKWMRSKSTLRTSAGLKITAGEANMACIESGSKALYMVRDWYLGDSVSLKKASKVLKTCTQTLSS